MQINLVHFNKWLSSLKKKIFDKVWEFHHHDITPPTAEEFLKKYFRVVEVSPQGIPLLPSGASPPSVEIYCSTDGKVSFLHEKISPKKLKKIAASLLLNMKVIGENSIEAALSKLSFSNKKMIEKLIEIVYQKFIDNDGMNLSETSTFFLSFREFFFDGNPHIKKFTALKQGARLRAIPCFSIVASYHQRFVNSL